MTVKLPSIRPYFTYSVFVLLNNHQYNCNITKSFLSVGTGSIGNVHSSRVMCLNYLPDISSYNAHEHTEHDYIIQVYIGIIEIRVVIIYLFMGQHKE